MKWVKRIALGLGTVVLLAALGLVTKFYLLSPRSRAAENTTAPKSPEAVLRGRYLANHVAVCTGCHSPVNEGVSGEPLVESMIGAGRDFGDHPELFPGRIRARNLTSDTETGLGAWSDGEIVRAMREGVSKDGRPLFPMMPYLTYAETFSDDDALAVVAYLRTLKPVKNDPGFMTVNFPISMFARAAPRPLEKAAGPEPTDPLGRGQWLLKAASCAECHTTTNGRHEPLPNHYLAGGNPFPIPGKGTTYTANLTSDKATGLGAYADEDILRAIDQGIGKGGRVLYGMPWPYYAGMTEDDKKALVLALRAVPPIMNVVPAAQLQL